LFDYLSNASLPIFSKTMKSVGVQLSKMVVEVHSKFNSIRSLIKERAKPDYATCIKISIDALLKKTITLGILVMLTPLIAATSFRFYV